MRYELITLAQDRVQRLAFVNTDKHLGPFDFNTFIQSYPVVGFGIKSVH
jgi:hypothetical protein